MNMLDRIKSKFSAAHRNKTQSRSIAAKLNDTHIKYAAEKNDGEEVIVGREGHINIVENDCFELVFGVKSVFKFKIDEMTIWEFMSLDGATVSGNDLNTGTEKTFIIYYDKHLTG